MCSILTTKEHQTQQQCPECNHCVHLTILHIQMVTKSRSNHTHTYKCCIHLTSYKCIQTSIEMCSILTTKEHPEQQQCPECNHFVHLSILHIQMVTKSRSNHTHTYKCCIHLTSYKCMQTSIEMCSILTTKEHPEQQQCPECNHCVHLSILHIQMVTKSRSNHTHTYKCCIHLTSYKGMQTSIEMCSILTTKEHPEQQQCPECNHCVHLSILHIQMGAKSRSNHTHTYKCCIHLTSLQRYANINRNVQYFDYERAPGAATMSRV